MTAVRAGVSFVLPVYDGECWLNDAIAAILAQDDGRAMEVVVVEDGSRDGSGAILARYAATGRIRVIAGPRRGAAAALNAGIRAARHEVICQVDQDVIVGTGWMSHLLEALEDPDVAAAQGYYVADTNASFWARVMGLDLEERYGRISERFVDHVCTGNTAYRAEAIRRVGLFDESFGYGYDNDMSYRLVPAGHRLVFCREARSVHRWREHAMAYLKQQYGVGFGRLDLVAKHRGRIRGDNVSGFLMILHAPLMLTALLLALGAAVLTLTGGSAKPIALTAAAIVSLLALERAVVGLLAWRKFRNPAGLWFAPLHLLRDIAWATAIVVWCAKRVIGRKRRPSDSM
jgi:succinoglycan biosynthesis protein ExoA